MIQKVYQISKIKVKYYYPENKIILMRNSLVKRDYFIKKVILR